MMPLATEARETKLVMSCCTRRPEDSRAATIFFEPMMLTAATANVVSSDAQRNRMLEVLTYNEGI